MWLDVGEERVAGVRRKALDVGQEPEADDLGVQGHDAFRIVVLEAALGVGDPHEPNRAFAIQVLPVKVCELFQAATMEQR